MITFCGGEQKSELGNYAVKSAVPRGWRNPLQVLIECSARRKSARAIRACRGAVMKHRSAAIGGTAMP
jgi:hypothetical protein